MPQIEINNLDDTVNFSQVSEEERKEFARKHNVRTDWVCTEMPRVF